MAEIRIVVNNPTISLVTRLEEIGALASGGLTLADGIYLQARQRFPTQDHAFRPGHLGWISKPNPKAVTLILTVVGQLTLGTSASALGDIAADQIVRLLHPLDRRPIETVTVESVSVDWGNFHVAVRKSVTQKLEGQ